MQNYTFIFLATFLFSFSLNSQTHQVVSASGGDASGIGGSAATIGAVRLVVPARATSTSLAAMPTCSATAEHPA